MNGKTRVVLYSLLAVFVALAVYATIYKNNRAQAVQPERTQQVQSIDSIQDLESVN